MSNMIKDVAELIGVAPCIDTEDNELIEIRITENRLQATYCKKFCGFLTPAMSDGQEQTELKTSTDRGGINEQV